jgi:hypothetical protein
VLRLHINNGLNHTYAVHKEFYMCDIHLEAEERQFFEVQILQQLADCSTDLYLARD